LANQATPSLLDGRNACDQFSNDHKKQRNKYKNLPQIIFCNTTVYVSFWEPNVKICPQVYLPSLFSTKHKCLGKNTDHTNTENINY